MATIEWRGKYAYLNRSEHGVQIRTSLGAISKGEALDELRRYELSQKGVEFSHGPELLAQMKRYMPKLLRQCEKNAKARGIRFELSAADLLELLDCGGPYCAVTGVPFSLDPFPGVAKRPWVPSIDRIDSAGAYVRGNVRLVCAMANFAMNQWGEKALLRLVRFCAVPTTKADIY